MTKPAYRIAITTCDKYLPVLRPMAWLLQKYWNPLPDVVIGGYTPPDFELPANFTFHSIGKMEDFPVNRWSNGLIKFLTEIPDEVVVLLLEDMWPVRSVHSDAVRILYDYMNQFRYVARMDLTADRLYAHGMVSYGFVSYLDLIKSMPGSPYHLSTMPGLWRVEHLLAVLIPGESPWDVELQGTPRLSHNQDVIVLGTRQWPMRNTLAFRGGDVGKLLLDELHAGDVAEMRDLGLLEPWE